MKIKRRDLNRLIENYLMLEAISSNAEADAFRLWMSKNHPEYKDPKTGEKLDKVYSGSGSSNNNYVKRAFKKHGKDYERHLKNTADQPSNDSDPKEDGKEYQTLDKQTEKDIEKLQKAAASGKYGESGVNTLGIKVWKGLGAAADFLGIDRLSQTLTEGIIPYHYMALLRFLTAINSKFTVEDYDAKRVMQRVCLAALKRERKPKKPGQKFLIKYADYGAAQPGANGNWRKAPQGFFTGSGFQNGEASDWMSDNLYGQMSVFIGNANAVVNDDGETFTINDQYDYNPSAVAGKNLRNIAKAVPTHKNKSKVIGRFIDFMLSKVGYGSSNLSSVKALEPVLVLLEASSGYPGYPVEVVTVKDEDEASLYQRTKSGIKSALGLDMTKDYIPFLQESKINNPKRMGSKMKINRMQLRKMILREMKMLNEGSADLNAKKGEAVQELIKRGILKSDILEPVPGYPNNQLTVDDVIQGIGSTAKEAQDDAEQSGANNMRGQPYRPDHPKVNHQLNNGLHVVVLGSALIFDDVDDVEDF